jgi:hypothetical protein
MLLARDYAVLGKSRKAALILRHGTEALDRAQTSISDETRVLYLLHQATALTSMDDVSTR